MLDLNKEQLKEYLSQGKKLVKKGFERSVDAIDRYPFVVFGAILAGAVLGSLSELLLVVALATVFASGLFNR